MKKIILIFILIIALIFLTGCNSAEKTVIENNKEVTYINGFRVIKILNDPTMGLPLRLVFDTDTNVIYYMSGSTESNAFCLSPYYIVKDGKAEIAVYGRNYFD